MAPKDLTPEATRTDAALDGDTVALSSPAQQGVDDETSIDVTIDDPTEVVRVRLSRALPRPRAQRPADGRMFSWLGAGVAALVLAAVCVMLLTRGCHA